MSTEAEQITRASRSNLALAFIALPPATRRDIRIFYAFCRIVDDIADEPGPSREEKMRALDLWSRALDGAVDGEHPLAATVREIIARHTLQPAQLREIIAGMAMDLEGARYGTWEGLRLYCHRAASVVGVVSAQIFGDRSADAEAYALNLGLALQLTNILRDIGEDFANGGRIYLPEEDMARFGVTRADIAAHRRSDGFLALMDYEATRARELYREAQSRLGKINRRAMIAAEVMRAVYSRLLEKMHRDRWHVFGPRYSLSRLTKLWLVARTMLRG